MLKFDLISVKTLPPLVGRLVPFIACSAANCINIPLMRRQELLHGTPLETLHGEKVGRSKVAATEGITMVTLSRIGMAMPGMVLIPIIMNNLDRKGLFRRYPKMATPLQVIPWVWQIYTYFKIFFHLGWSLWSDSHFLYSFVLCNIWTKSQDQCWQIGA